MVRLKTTFGTLPEERLVEPGSPRRTSRPTSGARQNPTQTDTSVFPLLQVGTYQLAVAAQGFKEFNESGIRLDVGKNVRLDARLEVGELAEKITLLALN
jgi:hypothetical protein